MDCALCLKNSELRNSHIFPEWIYKPLYDTKRRLQILSIVPEGRNEFKQKGMREYLLCDDCEQKLSVWEGYASKIFIAPDEPLEYVLEGDRLVNIRGLDYRKLKLFELSILWRAGVSKLPFFAKVKLGPHQEVLRDLLNKGEPSEADRYGVLMYGLKLGEEAETLKVITEPRPVRSYGVRAYNFTFGGFLWVFHVSSSDPPAPLRSAFLREDGSRYICIQNALEMGNMFAFAKELKRLGREPKSI